MSAHHTAHAAYHRWQVDGVRGAYRRRPFSPGEPVAKGGPVPVTTSDRSSGTTTAGVSGSARTGTLVLRH